MQKSHYDTDLTDTAWALVEPILPCGASGRPSPYHRSSRGNERHLPFVTPDASGVCCRDEFPPWGTVYHYFRCWENSGIWVQLHHAVYEQARAAAGRAACPSVVIMDGQSVKTTERGGTRGFDGYKRVKGRKRHILVDTLGLPIAHPGGASQHLGPPRCSSSAG